MEATFQSRRKLSEQELTASLRAAIAKRRPPAGLSGQAATLKRASQVSVAPPTFALFVNDRSSFRRSYVHYLINSLREQYGFRGTPLSLKVRTALRK